MRSYLGLALAILLTGSAYGSDRFININAGETCTFTVITMPYTVDKCHLKTPTGAAIDFVPGDETLSNDKYSIGQGNSMAACELSLNNADENDNGNWEMYFTHEGGVGASQMHIVTVTSNEITTSEANELEITDIPTTEHPTTEQENIKYLSEIVHSTRVDATIDISLNKEEFEEECYVHPPNGEMTRADIFQMAGVTVQSKSNYVSCRISIGPMTADLLGTWRLCGKSALNEEMRCQPANIAWNSNNGIANWGITTQLTAAHPVHLGGAVTSGTDGSGVITTCHVITPAGEDLVVSADVKYPHIEMTPTNLALCSIIISDITNDMLGNWIIVGRFNAVLGQNENRQPLNFFLYNEENPYEQAYNVTVLQNVQRLVRLDTQLTLEVSKRDGSVQDCIYKTPSGQTFDLSSYQTNTIEGVSFVNSDTAALCQIVFNPITEAAIGKWQITGKFRNGVLFDEIQQVIEIIKEDPANPLEDNTDRQIETLAEQVIETKMDTTHRIVIGSGSFIENESCHLITPDGLQYAFIDGFNVPGVEIINDNSVECGIWLNLKDEDMIGSYTLIARATRLLSPTGPIERRLPFTIRVEESFVMQNDISISQGADLYLHLNFDITTTETCTLYGPDGEVYTNAEEDPAYMNTCGYIVRKVDNHHTGKWIIEYGNQIKNRGSVNVHVLTKVEYNVEDFYWSVGDSIDTTVGPDNAVYCTVLDARDNVLIDGFGPCRIVVDRVGLQHAGVWYAYVGVPGSVLKQPITMFVHVKSITRPTVTTSLEINDPAVTLSCSLPAEHEVQACTFKTPWGPTLVAAHGVGENGFMFNGSFVTNYESNADNNACSLRLLDRSTQNLGIWRCAMQTTTGTYYGFVTVVDAHSPMDANVIEPYLYAPEQLTFQENEPAVMSCSTQTQLRYCYFRASNGTIFNVSPSMSSSLSYEYFGAGFDAGECGIRFKNGLRYRESGTWSCHVGLANATGVEQQVSMPVEVQADVLTAHYWQATGARTRQLLVLATIYRNLDIEYCRFIRIDGKVFTTGVSSEVEMNVNHCYVVIKNPTMLDLHPWFVAVKLTSLADELTFTTTENMLTSIIGPNLYGEVLFWMLIMFICLIPAMAAAALLPKKNREWTYRRANNVRNSFRNTWNNTFTRKPTAQAQANVNTPASA